MYQLGNVRKGAPESEPTVVKALEDFRIKQVSLFNTLSSSSSLFPLWPPVSTNRIKQVACGDTHTVCVNEAGDVYTWGTNKVSLFNTLF